MPNFTIDTNLDINAAPDAVWDVLTDFASYKEWSPGMRIEGALEVGTKLHVHLTGMSFKPKVLAATPGKELRWLGKLGHRGIAAGEHYFVITTNNDGTTRLNHGERYSGALIALATQLQKQRRELSSIQPGAQTPRRTARQSSRTQLALKDKAAETHFRRGHQA